MGTGIILILLTPFICILAGLFLFHAWATVRYTIQHRKPVPTLVLLGGLTISLFVWPLPPTMEETFFTSHRADLEEVVALAEAGLLVHGEQQCRSETAFVYPEGYEHLQGQMTRQLSCLFVYPQPDLTVHFQVRSFPRAIVYAAQLYPLDEERPSGICGYDGTVYLRLDTHWYICSFDVN